jgi:hypothetical protein
MRRPEVFAIVAIVAIVAVVSFLVGRMTAEPPTPQNTKDCVLDAMKGGARGPEAVALILHVCQGKFGAL